MLRKEYEKQYYANNADRIKKRTNEHYYDNKEAIKEQRHKRYEMNKKAILAKNRIWREANKERIAATSRVYHLEKTYGISVEEYSKLLISQDNRCAICLRSEEEITGKFHIDHSHTDSENVPKGYIRGILCGLCNQSLIGDRTDPEIFLRAYEYLKQHTGIRMPDEKRINEK